MTLEDGFGDLLGGAVDTAYHRHAVQDPLADPDQIAPEKNPRQGADNDQHDNQCDQAHTRNAKRQIGVQIGIRIIGLRHQRGDAGIYKVQQHPAQPDRDPDRRDSKQPCEKIAAQFRDDSKRPSTAQPHTAFSFFEYIRHRSAVVIHFI